MARIRSVHWKICESEGLADLPAEVERTYVRLWTHCDDEGRCKDNTKLIKAAIYPLHDDMTAEVIDKHLTMLEEAGQVVRYEVEGVRVVMVVKWAEYQRPQRPVASKLPPPHDTSASPPRDVCDDSASPPEDVVPVVGEGEGGGEGGLFADSSPPAPTVGMSDFEAVWQAYPPRNGKRVGKQASFEKWRALSEFERARFRLAVDNYAAACTDGLTIAKDPERFLKADYWKDWLTPAVTDRPPAEGDRGWSGNDEPMVFRRGAWFIERDNGAVRASKPPARLAS